MDAMFLNEASSTLDPNHRQKARLDPSSFKCMKLTKEFIKAHSDLHMFKGVAPNSKTCGAVVWVDDDGEPVATVAVGYPDEHRSKDDRYNWIGNLEINPKYRGHDLSSQVLDYAVHQLGGDALAVLAKNKVAKHVYDKYGFRTSKDSELAVGRKHSSYYQMFLREDIGTSVGELLEGYHNFSEKLNEGKVYFTKGPNGDQQMKVRDAITVTAGGRSEKLALNGTLISPDALLNQILVAPQFIDRNVLASRKSMREVAEMLSDIFIDNVGSLSVKNSDAPAWAASMFYVGLSRYTNGKSVKEDIIKRYLDLLPQDITDDELFDEYLKLVVEALDIMMRKLAEAVNCMAAAAGATIAEACLLLSDDVKDIWTGYDALDLEHYVTVSNDKHRTMVFDYSSIGRGVVIIGRENLETHNHHDYKVMAVRSLIKSMEYDYVIIAEGKKTGEDRIVIESISYGGKSFTDLDRLIDYLDHRGTKRFLILVCNENHAVLRSNNKRIHYSDEKVFSESAVPAVDDPLDMAILNITTRGELFKAWRKSISRIIQRRLPKTISPTTETLVFKLKADRWVVSVKPLKKDDPNDRVASFLKRLNDGFDIYANGLRVAKLVMLTLNRARKKTLGETASNLIASTMILDWRYSTPVATELHEASFFAAMPFTYDQERAALSNEHMSGPLSDYADLVESMVQLGLSADVEPPYEPLSGLCKEYYGSVNPFEVLTKQLQIPKSGGEAPMDHSEEYSSEKIDINGKPVVDREKVSYQKDGQRPVTVEIDNLDEAIAETGSLNRQSKDEIADRYDLRSVGNTHTLEDQERLSIEEYKRRKRIEAKRREKEKAKRDRIRRLQKAAAANRLKRKLTYLKSKLLGKKRTGPKNEDAGAVDDSESVAAEISSAREEMDNIAGARHRYYDSKTQYASTSTVGDVEPVIIEAATRIEFFDRVDEPEAKRTRPIYVGYTYKDGKINSVLVSFNPQLDPVYQIVPNRIYDGDFYQVKQYRRSDLLREQGDLEHKLFMALASENDQFNLEKRLNFYSSKHTKIWLVLPENNDAPEDRLAELASMTLGALLQKDSRWTTQLVSEGLLKDYNDEVVARYARAAERAEILKTLFPDTSDIEMYRQNPWAQDILEYKLMVMDDAAFNEYIAFIQKKMDEAKERRLKERPRYEW